MVPANISRTKSGFTFVQCSNCGTVIGVSEANNIAPHISVLKQEMNEDGFLVVRNNQQSLYNEIQEILKLVKRLGD